MCLFCLGLASSLFLHCMIQQTLNAYLGGERDQTIMLNWYFEVALLKYPALTVSEKTLKIPSIEPIDSLELLIKELSYLPFPLRDLS